ncbi:MAG: CDP-diacylglycerol--serine O-phosphatidyltransferase [Candidatus Methanoperedens sp.]|jgi:CDP-diacylglycerol--serine O-phosphatidyltransferase|nr:CDP-diacylglycerol--serine O-phosphatidyltransferase [Candidatus Methanoperedens sp.]PKL54513.1 MAG: CDP-diacylglycerol--serine O-phosphatidyltransferase [Candidatus Methanoperedenaceae archaeon HGW-Methanoperedenaceae-1]
MGESIIKLVKPADIVTLVNALLGLASIIMVIGGRIDSALILILIAVVADAADGAVARKMGSGVLGENLDSLADVISFGVAPAVVAYVVLGSWTAVSGLLAGLFMVCGILRLARFNVAGNKGGFTGIPITAGGFIVALFVLVKDYIPYFETVFAVLLVVLSLLMVSTIAYPKLKNPMLLAPMAFLLVVDITAFYAGYPDAVKPVSLVLLVLIFAYVLTPLGRIFHD